MELADKEGLAGSIKAAKVYKTSLTTDESKRIPKLKDGNEFDNQPATLLLATYYKMSQRAKESAGVQFDLVIVEEASQAFLATIGAARLLGQHCLIVGDQMQLQPIRLLNDEDLDVPYLRKIFNGLETIATSQFTSAKFILETTFRLTPFSTYLTNAFYGDRLKTEPKTETRLIYPVENEIAFSQKTVHVVELPMSVGVKTPGNAVAAITQLTGQLHRLNPKASIAVLSFYVVTVKELQRSISEEVVHSEHVIVETIDRIQGLTVDVCLWLIPNTGLNFSLNPHRFNVATSRARCQTIVFMPNSFAANSIDPLVNAWLNRYRQSTEA